MSESQGSDWGASAGVNTSEKEGKNEDKFVDAASAAVATSDDFGPGGSPAGDENGQGEQGNEGNGGGRNVFDNSDGKDQLHLLAGMVPGSGAPMATSPSPFLTQQNLASMAALSQISMPMPMSSEGQQESAENRRMLFQQSQQNSFGNLGNPHMLALAQQQQQQQQANFDVNNLTGQQIQEQIRNIERMQQEMNGADSGFNNYFSLMGRLAQQHQQQQGLAGGYPYGYDMISTSSSTDHLFYPGFQDAKDAISERGKKRKAPGKSNSNPDGSPKKPEVRQWRKAKSFSSKYRGVTHHKRDGRWLARAWLDGKIVNLGSFKTERKAARVVKRKYIEVYGKMEGSEDITLESTDEEDVGNGLVNQFNSQHSPDDAQNVANDTEGGNNPTVNSTSVPKTK